MDPWRWLAINTDKILASSAAPNVIPCISLDIICMAKRADMSHLNIPLSSLTYWRGHSSLTIKQRNEFWPNNVLSLSCKKNWSPSYMNIHFNFCALICTIQKSCPRTYNNFHCIYLANLIIIEIYIIFWPTIRRLNITSLSLYFFQIILIAYFHKGSNLEPSHQVHLM